MQGHLTSHHLFLEVKRCGIAPTLARDMDDMREELALGIHDGAGAKVYPSPDAEGAGRRQAGTHATVSPLPQHEQSNLHLRDGTLESHDQQVIALSAELESCERVIAVKDSELRFRNADIDALSRDLAHTQAQVKAVTAELTAVRVECAREGRERIRTSMQLAALERDYDALISSRMWRATSSIRNVVVNLVRAAYSLAKPHRTVARVRVFLERRPAQRSGGAVSIPLADDALFADGTRDNSKRSVIWFFLGDTIEWLQTHEQLTGVGKVTTELLIAASKPVDGARMVSCVLGNSKSGLVPLTRAGTISFLASRLRAPELGDSLALDESASKGLSLKRGDNVLFSGVVWSPNYSRLFERLTKQGVNVNVLLYDIIPIEHPELVGDAYHRAFAAWLETTVKCARTIFVCSNSLREKLYRWKEENGTCMNAKVVTIPFGSNEVACFASTDELAKHETTNKVTLASFVLSVGTIDRRKNQAMLVRLWSRLVNELGFDRVPQLVLIGRDDMNISMLNDSVASLFRMSKIVAIEGLSDTELAGLYHACLFTVFPSLSEGYGIPVAESLKYGKLCVSSDLECIQEHAGDFPWYFDPSNDENLYGLLRKAIEDRGARSASERRIRQNYRTHTWQDSYQAVIRELNLGKSY
jgi:glycosyltransferase involved in cell wall biosynthesis